MEKKLTPPNKPTEQALHKEVRELRRALQRISDAVLLHLHVLDSDIGKDKTIPKEASSKLGKLANWLEQENDRVRYHVLGVDYRKDDKAKAVQKLIRKAQRGKVWSQEQSKSKPLRP